MRVVGGRLRGRRLQAPAWEGLRPTSDRLRETVFNILGPLVEGARVVDACAGTGALGIEALSRGASHVTFVEHDRRAVALIRRNLDACGVTDGYAIVARAVGRAGRAVAEGAFDLVLLDAPYETPELDELILRASAWLAPTGWLVVEHGARRLVAERVGRLERARHLRAGDSALSFYRAAAE